METSVPLNHNTILVSVSFFLIFFIWFSVESTPIFLDEAPKNDPRVVLPFTWPLHVLPRVHGFLCLFDFPGFRIYRKTLKVLGIGVI